MPNNHKLSSYQAGLAALMWVLSLSPSQAGDDLIFISGFDLTTAQLLCPTAPPMTQSTNGLGGIFYSAMGEINPLGDTDYYSVPASSMDWYRFLLDGNFNNDPQGMDPLLSVYSANGDVLLAQNNDGRLGGGVNSDVIHQAASDGGFCLKVEDLRNTTAGGAFDDYVAYVLPLDFDLYDEYNLDQEPNDSTAMPQVNMSTNVNSPPSLQESTVVVGTFVDNSNEDVFLLPTPEAAVAMNLVVMPSGVPGNGSSDVMQSLDVLAADGSTVLAQIEPQLGMENLHVPAQAQTNYYVRSGAAGNLLGGQPFYVFYWQTLDVENPQETNDVANDDSTGAEIATPIPPFNNTTSHFLGGVFSGGSDTDWWQFQANAGDSIAVFCESWSMGSGVRNMAVELFDEPLNPALQSQTEDQVNGIIWFDAAGATAGAVQASLTGTHYLVLGADLFSGVVQSRHYQCGIFVTSN